MNGKPPLSKLARAVFVIFFVYLMTFQAIWSIMFFGIYLRIYMKE